jgi:hypothetical protein
MRNGGLLLKTQLPICREVGGERSMKTFGAGRTDCFKAPDANFRVALASQKRAG